MSNFSIMLRAHLLRNILLQCLYGLVADNGNVNRQTRERKSREKRNQCCASKRLLRLIFARPTAQQQNAIVKMSMTQSRFQPMCGIAFLHNSFKDFLFTAPQLALQNISSRCSPFAPKFDRNRICSNRLCKESKPITFHQDYGSFFVSSHK
jgi:hypothetical protein